MTSQTIWIATISTHDETVAVAHDETSAWNLATFAALQYLHRNGVDRFTTQEEVAEYFGVHIFEMDINTGRQIYG